MMLKIEADKSVKNVFLWNLYIGNLFFVSLLVGYSFFAPTVRHLLYAGVILLPMTLFYAFASFSSMRSLVTKLEFDGNILEVHAGSGPIKQSHIFDVKNGFEVELYPAVKEERSDFKILSQGKQYDFGIKESSSIQSDLDIPQDKTHTLSRIVYKTLKGEL
jgi:hypothetical protein